MLDINNLPHLVSTDLLAETLNCSRGTASKVLRDHPGFSVEFGSRRFAPRENVVRLLQGESPEAIAASVKNERVYVRNPVEAVA